jgi:hypothetical protein
VLVITRSNAEHDKKRFKEILRFPFASGKNGNPRIGRALRGFFYLEHDALDLSIELSDYLGKWYKTTTANKADKGATIDLTLDQFVGLFEKRQLTSLQKAIDENRLAALQNKKNPFAYVATWRSYEACSTRVWNSETALICSRMKSSTVNLPVRGEKLRPEHKAKIARKLTGKPKSAEHRQSISDSTKGGSKSEWTEERRAKRRADIAARKAN